jgi:hypothetical protein
MSQLWIIKKHFTSIVRLPFRAALVVGKKCASMQAWSVAPPSPPRDDGTVVVDAITVDGRHVDPFSPTSSRTACARP